jgi:hypothetical protein
MTRIRFTLAELELINDMCGIASAAAWGEGDYQQWEDPGVRLAYDSLRGKVWDLIERSKMKKSKVIEETEKQK